MSDAATGTGGRIRIFSGIQPTGSKHLGNLIGGVRQYVEGQEVGDSIYCLVDLHAITVKHDPAALRRQVHDTVSILIAAGLDPDRCILFRQSDVAEHTYLCWLLASVTAYGELRRMTQFKEKSAEQRDFVSSGLFLYPVLQAADILAYQTDEVPVGEDQKQHIELARTVAERFNSRYGQMFTVPRHRIPDVGARILDLQDPDKKMSTTGGSEQGTVYILDTPEAIARKFKSAITDSGREIRQAPDKRGISNLIEIMAVARGVSPGDIEREYASGPGYARFKDDVGAAVAEYLRPIRTAYDTIRSDESHLESILREGAAKARAIAAKTVETAADRMGLGAGSGADDADGRSGVRREAGRRCVRGRAPGLHGTVQGARGSDPRAEDRVRRLDRDGHRRIPRPLEVGGELVTGGGDVVPRRLRDHARAQGRPTDAAARGRGRGGSSRCVAGSRVRALDRARGVPDGRARDRARARRGGPAVHARGRPPAEFAHLYPDVLEDVNADDLARIAAVVLRPPPLVDLSHVTPIRYSMAEAVEAVRDHMGRLGQASFRDLVADCDERIQIVVRFLALLELYREGMVDLAQAATFGEIHIRWEGEAA